MTTKSNENKKNVEPFNLFGLRSVIHSKDEAAKILKDNSYYFFVITVLLASIYIISSIADNTYADNIKLLVLSIYYLILGVAIRLLKSRVASVLALISFISVILI